LYFTCKLTSKFCKNLCHNTDVKLTVPHIKTVKVTDDDDFQEHSLVITTTFPLHTKLHNINKWSHITAHSDA